MAVNTRNSIVTNGLVLALDAGNTKSYTSGSATWRDISGNNNSGSLINGPTFDGGNGGSIVFDGSNKRATLASPFGQPGFTTLSTWYNRVEGNSSTTWRTLYATTSTNTHHLISQSTTRELGIYDGSFRGFGYTPPIDGKFHNYTVIYQSATNATLYVDGQFISTIVVVLDLSTSLIGSIGNWSGGNYWVGNIALTQIYNRALSQQEIIQNYNATKTRFGLS
jgi:hypothetical protein